MQGCGSCGQSWMCHIQKSFLFFLCSLSLSLFLFFDGVQAYAAYKKGLLTIGLEAKKVTKMTLQMLPHSLGTSSKDSTGRMAVSVLLEKNRAAPCEAEDVFVPCYKGQPTIPIDVYQGESKYVEYVYFTFEYWYSEQFLTLCNVVYRECVLLAHYDFPVPHPNQLKHKHNNITIKFEASADLSLKVTATSGDGKTQKLDIDRRDVVRFPLQPSYEALESHCIYS
jgi:hypothetical protein